MTERTKVLYLSPVAERGGAETVLLNILKYQDREAFEPVVGFLQSGPLIDEVRQLGVRTIEFPSSRFRRLLTTYRTIRSIRAFLHQERVGLVFGNMAMGHLYGGLAAFGTQSIPIWFLHGVPRWKSGLDLAAAWVPSKLIFVFTEGAGRALAQLSPFGRINLVPGCVDLARFNPGTVQRDVLRQELGIAPAALLVANIARLQRWKGQSLFLQAAAMIYESLPGTHFLLVGGTLFGRERGYAKDLLEQAARLRLSGNVHFLGHRHDIPTILADVDVLVHCPLTPEPFGLVALEAMAMQVPVVATRAGGLEETVEDGETGVLVPPGDAGALATAVLRTLGDPAERQSMGMAGRHKVEKRFSAESMVRHVESAFRRVLAGEH